MQFLFPNILFGLFAISIPIIIHLFNFRKYKTVYFSNTLYLKNIKQNTKSRSRLKHLLILITRILTIICLVFAFSQPFIPSHDNVNVVKNEVIGIYLDNSFSMDAESKYGKLIEIAKNRAIDIANSYESSTEFMFYTNERKSIHNHLINKEQLSEFVKQTASSPITLNISEAVSHFLNNISIEKDKTEVPKKLFILTDLQKNIVDIEFINDSLLNLVFVPILKQNTNNIYIDSCWFSNPYRKFETEEEMYIRIVNNSDDSYQNIPISFYINDSAKAYSSVNLEAWSSATETIKYTNTFKGIYDCVVKIEDYPIVHDNNYFFSYNIVDNIRILSIYKDQVNRNIEFLYTIDDYIQFDKTVLDQLDYSLLERYNLVILSEIKEPSSILINQLLNYVKEGGRLVIIPAENAEIDVYNLFLSSFNNNLIQAIDTNEVEIGGINFLSDVYLSSFTNENEEHIFPKINKYFKSVNFSNNRSISLLNSKNGFTLLNYLKHFKGDIFTFYFPLSANNNTFNIHPLFVPTFFNIALTSQYHTDLSYTIGKISKLETNTQIDNYDNVFSLKNTATNFEFIPRIEQASNFIIHLQDQIKEAGNYNLVFENQTVNSFAFNYDKKESKLESLSEDELKSLLESKNIKDFEIITEAEESFEYKLNKLNQGVHLWYYFIVLALIFVLIEILLIRFLK